MEIRKEFLFNTQLENILKNKKDITKDEKNQIIKKITDETHEKISIFLKNDKIKYNKRKSELNFFIDDKLGIIKKRETKSDGLIRYGNKIILYKHNVKLFSRYDFFVSLKSKNNPEKLSDGLTDILRNNIQNFFKDFFNEKKNYIKEFTSINRCEVCNRTRKEAGQLDKAHEKDRPAIALKTAKKLLQNYDNIHLKVFLICFMYEHKNNGLWQLCKSNCHKYLDKKGVERGKRYNIKYFKPQRTKSLKL